MLKRGYLEKKCNVYINQIDKHFIKSFQEYEKVIITESFLAAKHHIIFLWRENEKDGMMPGVLEQENLIDKIEADYPFCKVFGPLKVSG